MGCSLEPCLFTKTNKVAKSSSNPITSAFLWVLPHKYMQTVFYSLNIIKHSNYSANFSIWIKASGTITGYFRLKKNNFSPQSYRPKLQLPVDPAQSTSCTVRCYLRVPSSDCNDCTVESLIYNAPPDPKFKCFSPRLVVVFLQYIEARSLPNPLKPGVKSRTKM